MNLRTLFSQSKLLDKFPEEAGAKDPARRIVPFLPGEDFVVVKFQSMPMCLGQKFTMGWGWGGLGGKYDQKLP